MTLVGDHRRTRRPAPVTAAARQVAIRDGKVEIPLGLAVDDRRLWGYYSDVDIVHFGMGFKRNAALRARFMPAKVLPQLGADPEPIPEEATGDALVAMNVFRELDAERGRVAEAAGDMLVHLDVAGICFPLYQRRNQGEEEGEVDRLTVYSSLEIKKLEGRWQRVVSGGNKRLEGDWQVRDGDLVAAVWRPSPADRAVPDPPLRAVADECDLLLSLTSMLQASTLTRINAGILVVPDEVGPPPPPIVPGDATVVDQLLADMNNAFSAAITQPDHPSRFNPYLLRGQGEATSRVQRIDLGRAIQPADLALFDLVQRRIAKGLDLPAAIIEGLEQANHWSGWLVDGAAYRQHVDPGLLIALDGLTRHIYQKLLVGKVARPEDWVIWRDISALTASPNRSADAFALWDRRVINSYTLRSITGYDDTDARQDDPDPEPEGSADEPERAMEGPAESSPPPEAEEAAASTKGPVALVPSFTTVIAAEQRRKSGRRLAQIDRSLTMRLGDAAQAASQRALDRAGARIRTKSRNDAQLTAMMAGVPNSRVGQRLGRVLVEETLAITAAELVTEADLGDFEEQSRRLLDRAQGAAAAEVQTLAGQAPERDPADEQADVDSAVAILVAAVMAGTLARLFTPGADPDPADTGEVPDAGVLSGRTLLDATTVAGGGLPGVIPDQAGFDFGVGNGPRTVDQLRALGLVTIAWRWEYGDRFSRRTQFEPHLYLDGIEFDRWDDPSLGNRTGFPLTVYYHPGDHAGCLCGAERVLWVNDQPGA